MELYHIVNRGVDKRTVFEDNKDYFRFIHNLYAFNDQQASIHNGLYSSQTADIGCRQFEKMDKGKHGRRKQQSRKLLVQLHAFCLMPNHYHLLMSPLVEDGIPKFMKKLNMGYSKYFNEKNTRTGALWQGKYRKVHIVRDAHFMFIPFYIHLNPLDLTEPAWRKGTIRDVKQSMDYLQKYRWSSHSDYLNVRNFPSVTQRELLNDYFAEQSGYTKAFTSHIHNLRSTDLHEAAFE